MRRFALLVAVVSLTAPASADTLKMFGEIHGGGMYGKGTTGDLKDSAFFGTSPHGMYGFNVGAEFLFFDGWIQHHQYTDGSRITTWTQFGVGAHALIDNGSEKERKAGKGGFMEFSGGLFFGVGTGQQVDPPLDNAQLSDKAFLLQGSFGMGTHLSRQFDIAVALPVSYGYFFKSGNGASANDVSTHYRSVQGEAMLILRGNLHIF